MLTDFSDMVLVSLCIPTVRGQEKLADGFVQKNILIKQGKTILNPKVAYDLFFDKFNVTANLFEEEESFKLGRKVVVAKGVAPLTHDDFINHLREKKWVIDLDVLNRYHLAQGL